MEFIRLMCVCVCVQTDRQRERERERERERKKKKRERERRRHDTRRPAEGEEESAPACEPALCSVSTNEYSRFSST